MNSLNAVIAYLVRKLSNNWLNKGKKINYPSLNKINQEIIEIQKSINIYLIKEAMINHQWIIQPHLNHWFKGAKKKFKNYQDRSNGSI